MNRIKTILSSFLFGLVIFLFIFTLPMYLLIYNLGRVAFDAPGLHQSLTAELVESDLVPAVLPWSAGQIAFQRLQARQAAGEPDLLKLFEHLELADWREIYRTAVPALLIDDWVARILSGFYAWLDSEETSAPVSLDATPLQMWVTGPHGKEVMSIIYSRLKPCTAEQEQKFQTELRMSNIANFELCRYSEPTATLQFAQFTAAMDNVSAYIPQTIIIMERQPAAAASPSLTSEVIKYDLRWFRLVAGLGWLLPLVLLLLAARFALENRLRLATWWGIPLLAAGVLALIPALYYPIWLRNILAWIFIARLPGPVLEAITTSVLHILKPVLGSMLAQSITLALMGITLVLQWVPVWLHQRKVDLQAMQEITESPTFSE